MKGFLNAYFRDLRKHLELDDELQEKLVAYKNLFQITQKSEKKVIIVGNGGSAAMANHVTVDLIKNAEVQTRTSMKWTHHMLRQRFLLRKTGCKKF